MTPGKTIDTYIDLFHRALKESLVLRQWPFAALAGIISTGLILQGVVDAAFFLKPVESLSESIWLAASSQLTALLLFVNALVTFPTATVVLLIGAGFLVSVIAIIIGLYSLQFTLAAARKSPSSTNKEIRKEVHGTANWRLFGIHALRRVASLLIVSVAIIPLSHLLGEDPLLDAVIFVAFFLLVLPAVFVIQSIAMKASFITTRNNHSIVQSISDAFHAFKKHWLATLEFNVLLYAMVLAVGAVAYIVVSSFNLILALFLELLSDLVSSALATTVTVVIYLVLFAIAWMLTGFVLLFIYNAWERFLENIQDSPLHTMTDHFVNALRR